MNVKAKLGRMEKYERWINGAALKAPKAFIEAAYIDLNWIPFRFQALAMFIGYSEKLADLAQSDEVVRKILEWSWTTKNR